MGKNLIIRGADFSENAIPTQFILTQNIVVGGTVGTVATLRKGQTTRSTILQNGESNTLWGTDGTNDNADKVNYALIEIPLYAKKIKVTCANIVLSIGLFDSAYKSVRYPEWSGSDGVQEIDLTSFPTAKYFSTNFQNANVSLSSVKIEFSF